MITKAVIYCAGQFQNEAGEGLILRFQCCVFLIEHSEGTLGRALLQAWHEGVEDAVVEDSALD
jgi:hypothetical protein